MSINESWNTLSSVARTVIPRSPLPETTFSLVIKYFDNRIDKVEFQIPPETITESKGVNYASETPLGRFEPIRMYTNSEATRITFSVNYYWLEESFTNSIGSWYGIKNNVNKLRALLYPYDSGRQSDNINASTGLAKNIEAAQRTEEMNMTVEQNAFNQYVGKLSPPPTIYLYFGDLYQGTPCILTDMSIEYKGPWNDASLASFARRLAAQTASRFSSGAMKTVNLINQRIEPVTTIVNLIPGPKPQLVNTIMGALRQDKLFPLVTTVNISLATNYPFGSQLTYRDIYGIGQQLTSGVSKIIENGMKFLGMKK